MALIPIVYFYLMYFQFSFQTQGSLESLEVESVCRLYEVGRLRKVDGEDEEDEVK